MYSCRKVSIKEDNMPDVAVETCNNTNLYVTIRNTVINDFDSYKFIWSDGTTNVINNIKLPYTISKTFGYSASQSFTIEGIYNSGVSCSPPRPITVKMNRGEMFPRIRKIDLNEKGDKATLTITGNPDAEYFLYTRSILNQGKVPDSNMKKVSIGETSMDIPNPSKSTCFALGRRGDNGCVEIANEVCTIPSEISSDGFSNTLTFDSPNIGIIPKTAVYTNILSIKNNITRTDNQGKSTLLGSKSSPFVDKSINCKLNYCYSLIHELVVSYAGYIDEGYLDTVVISQKKCINREKISASPIKDISVTVNDKALTDILYQDDSAWPLKREKYFLYKEEGNQYVKIDSSATAGQTFTDTKNLPTLASHCYKIQFRDECGSLSELSPPACSIFLTENAVKDLQWTAASPFALGGLNRYEVLALNEASLADERLIIKSPYDNTHHPDLSPYEAYAPFQIKAVSYTGKESRSNILKIPIPVLLYFPSAFSPNGDDINETFLMLGKTKRLRQFRLEVFNRWGNLVFSTDQVDFHWEGLEPAVYTFRLEAVLDNDSIHRQTGTFSIIR